MPRAFSDSLAHHSEHHTIADFQAGKDIGLGLFGHDGTSTLNAGVRFASFSAKFEHAYLRAAVCGFFIMVPFTSISIS